MWYFDMNQLFRDGESKISDLRITYKGEDVVDLTSCFIAFWNNGKETIKRADVAEKIAISVSDPYSILDAKVIGRTADSNKFIAPVKDDQSIVEFDFEYLDRKDGAVVQIFTDCTDRKKFKKLGKVMGCRKFKEGFEGKNISFVQGLPVVMGSASISFGLFFILGSFIGINTVDSEKVYNLLSYILTSKDLSIVISIPVILFGVVLLIMSYFSYSFTRMPKDLKKLFNMSNKKNISKS